MTTAKENGTKENQPNNINCRLNKQRAYEFNYEKMLTCF